MVTYLEHHEIHGANHIEKQQQWQLIKIDKRHTNTSQVQQRHTRIHKITKILKTQRQKNKRSKDTNDSKSIEVE